MIQGISSAEKHRDKKNFLGYDSKKKANQVHHQSALVKYLSSDSLITDKYARAIQAFDACI